MYSHFWFIDHASWWLLVDALIVGVLLPKVILQRRETGATLAWVLVIILLPYVGLLAFWLFGTVRLRLRRRRRRRIEQKLAPALEPLTHGRSPTMKARGRVGSLIRLASRLDEQGPLAGNDVEIFRDGPATFDALEREIDAAKDHVHLLYYIWAPDRTGRRIRDALVRARERGVEVRVLIDDVGSYTTRREFFRPLLRAGGKVDWFLKVSPLSRQLTLNNRNHRKIVVVDGDRGFTGGMNIGDEYAGIGEPWKDLHCFVRGPVVHSFQEVFSQDWYHTTGEDLATLRYFPQIPAVGEIHAQLLASGPADEQWRAIPTLIFAAINLAKERVWIETPYFIPDEPMSMALRTAALRGVDVRLLIPGKTDHWLVSAAANYFVDELIEAGVKVYQDYTVMRHGKAVIVDDWFATVGSANMDQRSFRLNFEANLFFYSGQINARLGEDFLSQVAVLAEVTAEMRSRIPRYRKLLEGVARLLSPLL